MNANQWRTRLNMVMNFQTSYTAENFLDNQVDIIFKDKIRRTELVSQSVSQLHHV
jgi:hypothetical protein